MARVEQLADGNLQGPTAPRELSAADLRGLEDTFAPPRWLRSLGRSSWLLIGTARYRTDDEAGALAATE